jgi:hypothetical protein
MNSDLNDDKERQAYARPRLRKIELVSDEVLAGGCKTQETGGPDSTPCMLVVCSGLGS